MIEKLMNTVREQKLNVYSISQIKDGKEHTEKLVPANDCNDIYSVSKSITSTALGILSDRGIISIDKDIYSIFSEDYPEINKDWKKVTIKNVLTHTTGIEQGFLDIDTEDIREYKCNDFLKIALDHIPTIEPGIKFVYSDSNYYIISRIIEKYSGMDLEAFLTKEIFQPLQFQGAAFAKCPMGHSMGATGLFLRTIDMARFGKMCLDKGVYKGKRIVSDEWLNIATSEQVRLSPDSFYGFGFSGDPRDQHNYIICGGMYGQKIFISKKHNFVISWTCHDEDGSVETLVKILIENE